MKNFFKAVATTAPVLFLMGMALAYLLNVSTAVRIYLCPLLNFSRGMMEMRSTDHCSSRPCTKILSCLNLRLALLNFVYGSCVFSHETSFFQRCPHGPGQLLRVSRISRCVRGVIIYFCKSRRRYAFLSLIIPHSFFLFLHLPATSDISTMSDVRSHE